MALAISSMTMSQIESGCPSPFRSTISTRCSPMGGRPNRSSTTSAIDAPLHRPPPPAPPLPPQELVVVRPSVGPPPPAGLAKLPPYPLRQLFIRRGDVELSALLAEAHDPLKGVRPPGPLLFVLDDAQDPLPMLSQEWSFQGHLPARVGVANFFTR